MSVMGFKKDDKLRFENDGVVFAVIGTGYHRTCLDCGKVQKLELRMTEDGVVRDQPYCCRGKEATTARKLAKASG